MKNVSTFLANLRVISHWVSKLLHLELVIERRSNLTVITIVKSYYISFKYSHKHRHLTFECFPEFSSGIANFNAVFLLQPHKMEAFFWNKGTFKELLEWLV